MQFKKFLSLIFILPSLLTGEVIETAKIGAILTHLSQEDTTQILVVCDIDNTLLTSLQQLGSVAWGEQVVEDLTKKGVDPRDAADIQNLLWKAVQPHLRVRTIDPETAFVIEEIQKKQIPILALTARFPIESNYTKDQLQSVGIELSTQKYLPSSSHEFMLEKKALYQEGILFSTTYNKKSDVLFTFLEKCSLHPEKLIFVDDKLHHVEDVEQACQKRGIQCIALRFSGADEQMKNYHPSIAAVQWEAFPIILTDEEALEAMKN